MANLQYFAGNTLASFFRTNLNIIEVTTAGRFDASYVSNAINLSSLAYTDYIQSTPFNHLPANGSFFLRMDTNSNTWPSGHNQAVFTLLNGTTEILRFNSATSSTIQAQYWNGSTYVNTGAAFTYYTSNVLNTIVCRVDFTAGLASGFEFYVAGTSVGSGSGWTGTPANAITGMRAYSNTLSTYVSQIMCANYDLRDSHYMLASLNGNSVANAGGTGSYTNLLPPLDDSTSVQVTTSGNKQGQTHAAVTPPAGYVISAAVVSARGRVGGSITDGKMGVRTSAGLNDSGSGLGYNGGYEPRQRIVTADASTGTQFTTAGFNGAEIYEEAV